MVTKQEKHRKRYGQSHFFASTILLQIIIAAFMASLYTRNIPIILLTGILCLVLLVVFGEWMDNAWFAWIDPTISNWFD